MPMSAGNWGPLLHSPLALPPSTLRLFFRFLWGAVVSPSILAAVGVLSLSLGLSVSVGSSPPSWSVMSFMPYMSAQHDLPFGISPRLCLRRLHSPCSDSCGRRTHMRWPCLWLVACGIWTLQTHSILSIQGTRRHT
jgi:hypothetical protein